MHEPPDLLLRKQAECQLLRQRVHFGGLLHVADLDCAVSSSGRGLQSSIRIPFSRCSVQQQTELQFWRAYTDIYEHTQAAPNWLKQRPTHVNTAATHAHVSVSSTVNIQYDHPSKAGHPAAAQALAEQLLMVLVSYNRPKPIHMPSLV